MKLFSILSLVVFSSSLLFSVRAKETADPGPAVKLVPIYIRFNNKVGTQNLVLNKGAYTNESGEQFTVSTFQYFVSNIKLRTATGKEYIVPQDSSYFLVNEGSDDTKLVRINVPEGEYNQLNFVLGVDSLRNTMNISKRTGVLDPANAMDHGMYWGWNSGYIFFKMEGTSQQSPVDPSGQRKFRYHIGGFGGYSAPTINNIKNVSLDLIKGGVVKARKGKKTDIYVGTDVLRIFNGSSNISIAAHSSVMFSEYSVNVANNYSQMFFHDHTENL